MLDDYSRVRRYEETDDVMQNALLRLDRALSAVAPASEADFFRLAAAQIRRELIDLARHHFGAEGAGAHESPMPSATESCPEPLAVADTTHMPSKLAAWAELHERVAALPAEQRDLFDLLWYQELTQPEAAELLGVPLRTLKRQWQAVRRTLADQLGDSLPF
jgi:RNA polymerase sigma-70 factor (ECF subfamily)